MSQRHLTVLAGRAQCSHKLVNTLQSLLDTETDFFFMGISKNNHNSEN